jgi:hypothetical protein
VQTADISHFGVFDFLLSKKHLRLLEPFPYLPSHSSKRGSGAAEEAQPGLPSIYALALPARPWLTSERGASRISTPRSPNNQRLNRRPLRIRKPVHRVSIQASAVLSLDHSPLP